VTGTGSLTLPIHVSPGRSGFGPELSLSYDSGSGQGPFGLGWALSLPAITRKTDKGLPRYQDHEESDVFMLAGHEDLVPVTTEAGGTWTREKLPDRTVDGVSYHVQRYRPRTEGLFARIERWTALDTGESHWRTITRDNVTTLYGRNNNSRIFDPTDPDSQHPTRIFSWLICSSFDDRGNEIAYEYKSEDSAGVDATQANERNRTSTSRSANRYLKSIKYGNRVSRLAPPDPPNAGWLFEVVLDYGEHHTTDPQPDDSGQWLCRNDPFSSYRAGFEVRTYRLCQRVLMFHHIPEPGVGANCLVRSTSFAYRDSRGIADDVRKGNPVTSVMAAVSHSGHIRKAGSGYTDQSLPPLELKYSEAIVADEVRELDSESLENLPGLDGTTYRWVDLDGEGLSGILTDQANAWFYKPNLGDGRFGPTEPVTAPPLAALSGGPHALMDLAGDGQLDIAAFSGPVPGYSERTEDRSWGPFRPFAALPAIRWDDPNLRFVDLSGDGHADAVITEDNVITWYASRAEEGFEAAQSVALVRDEEQAPHLVFADETMSVYLADMSGGGLTDVVRIRNGEVSYWPNLGYGRFGAKVTMDDAPWFDSPDQFDQRRVRLADIDGSGCSDIVYLARDGVDLYLNQAGNRWSSPRRLTQYPAVDNVASVSVTDLLGNGTPCLVWSSPLAGDTRSPVRYIDLMGGTKPHLLTLICNNLGAETHVHYAPSTKFYLADKAAGKPWLTRLPFPVHVVEKIEVHDRVSRNRFVTRHAYHHGHFDGIDREFRGFGMVEQWDTEEFATLTESGVLAEDVTNLDEASHVPPVLTRTWLHTGAFSGDGRVTSQFESAYWRESDASLGLAGLTDAQLQAMSLPDTLLPTTIRRSDGTRVPIELTADEIHEAARLLKGSVLRQEVYGLDGSEAEDRPYTVSERDYTVELLQPRGAERHAVGFVHAREQIDLHYERTLYEVGQDLLADPRVEHSMTLDMDGYGNVLRSATIGYGRRRDDPDPVLSAADKAKQKRARVIFTDTTYTNSVSKLDAYRTPLSCDARTYELLKVKPASSAQLVTKRFGFDELNHKLDLAGDGQHDIQYQDVDAMQADKDEPYRRLLERTRTRYRRDNLDGPLALGELQALALTFESYRQAFTPGLVEQVFVNSGKLAAAAAGDVLGIEGGYVHSAGDANWWAPSGRFFFSPDQSGTPEDELAFARRHFFLPHRYRDPFHTPQTNTESTLAYDEYKLLMTETRDALSNAVTSVNHYRALAPQMVTDPNGNRTAVRFDALGLVTMAFAIGKPGANEGDRFDATSSEVSAQDDPTTRLEYDLLAHVNDPARRRPASVQQFARERHGAANPRWQQSYSYSDGFGREIQKKQQAGPGPLTPGGPVASSRWVSSGWMIFNNKGKAVRQYEPFFDDTYAFRFGAQTGVSPVMFYDPLGKIVATLHPNRTYEKAVFDPWRQDTWDVNDTVLQTHPDQDAQVGDFFRRLPSAEYKPTWYSQRENGGRGTQQQAAAAKTAAHAETPTTAHLDAFGRIFLTVVHNGKDGTGAEVLHCTRGDLDIQGNRRKAIDANNRVAAAYVYDMLRNPLEQASMEAGTRRMLSDAAGRPIRAWDARGHEARTEYDQLRRPVQKFVRGTGVAADPATLNQDLLFERIEYGEGQPQAAALNLRTRAFKQFDGAGTLSNEAFDFKGNLLRSNRALAQNYKTPPDWSAAVQTEAALASSTAYDALNRPMEITAADGSMICPFFNEANQLKAVKANVRRELANGQPAWTTFIADMDYDAKGQRLAVRYGSGAETTYTYDEETFRLVQVVTARNAVTFADDCPQNPTADWPGCAVQNLSYTYDPAGNVTHVRDDAQQTVFFRNKRVEPSAGYTYDAAYRLVEATGREHLGQVGAAPPFTSYNDAPRTNLPLSPSDGNAMARYVERYVHDAAGNLEQLVHRGTDPAHAGWTRLHTYEEPSELEPAKRSNRLTRTTIGTTSETYSYDDHGNARRMPQLQVMEWDFNNRLKMSQRQAVNGADTDGVNRQGERTWYVYDASGTRVRKVTELATGQLKDERIYLQGFELYRRPGANAVTRETLHIMDDTQRVALVETRTDVAVPERTIRYQHASHLGAAILELDHRAHIVSYEEYTPYGSTSYQATRSQTEASKRYRYNGRERDEESGLYYHGARYYAPWLARWTSCDPAGPVDGPNLYAFARNSPTTFRDPTGLIGEGPTLPAQGLLPEVGDWGNVLPYNKQPRALYDAAGKRLTENEHIVPRGNLEAVTTNPDTGLADYTKSNYRKDATVRVERGFALEKTAGNVAADNPRTAALKADVTQGKAVNYRDVFTDAIDNAKAARDRVGSAVPDEAINRGALSQDANMFALQSLEESAKKVKAAGAVIEDFDIVEHTVATAQQTSKVGKVLNVAGKALEVGGGVLGSATGGWQVGTGIDQLAQGKTGEGTVNVAEGGVNLGMTIGVPALVKSGAIVAGGGAIAVTAVTLVATASVGLAAETARAAVKGEETPLDVADKFYGTHFGDIYGWASGKYSKR